MIEVESSFAPPQRGHMDKVLIYWDREGNSLNVWFDDPKKEFICEETGDEVVIVKDKAGKVIGFEKLNYRAAGTTSESNELPVEVLVA